MDRLEDVYYVEVDGGGGGRGCLGSVQNRGNIYTVEKISHAFSWISAHLGFFMSFFWNECVNGNF